MPCKVPQLPAIISTFYFVPPVGFEPTYRKDQYDYFLKRVCFTDKCRYVGICSILQIIENCIGGSSFFWEKIFPRGQQAIVTPPTAVRSLHPSLRNVKFVFCQPIVKLFQLIKHKYVGPERLELPMRDAIDLQSTPMPSPVTTPKCGN